MYVASVCSRVHLLFCVMIIILIFLAISTNTASASLEGPHIYTNYSGILDEYILCRSCGCDISSSSYLIPEASPLSRYTFNDTLFRRDKVLVQVLSNNLIFDFPVITARHSNCVTVGEWEEHETWFPGYRWKVCACPECGEFVGWLFEPIEPSKHRKKPFYGLILWSLIGESCKYYYQILLVWGVFSVCLRLLILLSISGIIIPLCIYS